MLITGAARTTLMRLIWDRAHNIASIRLVEGDLTGMARDAWQPSADIVFDLGAEGTVINIQGIAAQGDGSRGGRLVVTRDQSQICKASLAIWSAAQHCVNARARHT